MSRLRLMRRMTVVPTVKHFSTRCSRTSQITKLLTLMEKQKKGCSNSSLYPRSTDVFKTFTEESRFTIRITLYACTVPPFFQNTVEQIKRHESTTVSVLGIKWYKSNRRTAQLKISSFFILKILRPLRHSCLTGGLLVSGWSIL